ncbi:MAG TPA: hypothetical protein VJY39_04545 [Acidisphaera sp.]|nr:hypothetical protein [Acidisphaera sp.]
MVEYRRQVTLDLTPDGQFVRRTRLPIVTRIAIAAVLVAMIAGGLAFGALVIGVAITLLPIAAIALVVAYVAFRIEVWRRRPGGGQRGLFRP